MADLQANQWQPQIRSAIPASATTELRALETFLAIDENLIGKGDAKFVHGDSKKHSAPASHLPASEAGLMFGGLEFDDLTYTVEKKVKREGKWVTTDIDLLHGISGVAPKGQITAVMGPSGAGKSTFLDALAGRIAKGSLGGLIKFDGQSMNPSLIKRVSSYVMQDDQLFPMLTVRETLLFAADVRLGNTVSRLEKQERVAKLLDQLGLTHAENTFIGDEGHRGVSGGERRRVSIGVDIIHGPSLLFLDEPTSGLDSTSAFSVIEKVQGIAENGSAVILTIHQPSYRIQQLLNRLIILARGKLIYQGPPANLTAYLTGMGRKLPKGENSIEYLLDVIEEYDRSVYGVDPLATYARDGIPPRHNGPLPERTPTPGRMKALHQGIASPARTGAALFGLRSPANLRTLQGEMKGAEAPVSPFLSDIDDGATYDYDRSVRSPWVGVGATGTTRTPENASAWYYRGLETFRLTPRRPQVGRIATPSRYTPTGEITPATPGYSNDYTVRESDFETYGESYDGDYPYEGNYFYGPKFANTWVGELLILTRRNFLNIRRTPELFMSRTMVLTVMGAMLASLFYKTHANLQGVTNLLAFFIFTVCLFFFSSNDAVPAFIQERFIFIRETSHNAYRSSSYAVAGLITYLPFFALQAIIYTLIVWFALKLYGGFSAFLFMWLILYASLLTTNSFVVFVSTIVPNYILGYAAVIAFTALFFLNCGYFLKRTQIPPYWIWLHYSSTMKYPYEALLMNQFDNTRCYSTKIHNVCPFSGHDILTLLAANKPSSKWTSLLILLVWGIFYRILFYLMLRFASKNQRK